MMRLLEMIKATDRALDPFLDSSGTWALEAFVVGEQWRGQGIGCKTLGQMLRSIQGSGKSITLMTQTEANVRFYSRLGFEVCNAQPLPLGTCGIKNWVMRIVLRPDSGSN